MNDIVTFKDEQLELEVNISPEEDTVWLTQAQMVDLFSRDQSVIARHIRNIFKEHELEEKSNMHFLHIANSDKPVKMYSLDVIISVGYRVKSPRGVLFRKWATNVLRQYFPIKTKKPPFYAVSRVFNMVGAARFELTASCTRNKRATKLRHAPTFLCCSLAT